jgi:hypothetical protein
MQSPSPELARQPGQDSMMLTESLIQDETMSEIRRNNGQLLSPFDSTPSIADIGDLSIEEAHIILRFDRS